MRVTVDGNEAAARYAELVFERYPSLTKRFPKMTSFIPKYAGAFGGATLAIGIEYLWNGRLQTGDFLSAAVTAYSFGAGLLVGLRVTLSMGLGMLLSWVIAPGALVGRGWVHPAGELVTFAETLKWVMSSPAGCSRTVP